MSTTAERRARTARRWENWLWTIPVVVILIAWAVIPPLFDVPEYKAPPPLAVVEALIEIIVSGALLEAVMGSLGRLLLAFGIGTALGISLGMLMASSRSVLRYVTPLVVFFQAIAGVAWIPLAILWFGLGTGPVVFVVANAVFFIVLFNTIMGVQSIPPRLYDAARVLGASRWDLIREVSLPGALVSVLAGAKSGLAFGWRALIGAELIVAGSGLGFLVLQGSRDFRGDIVLAAIPIIGLLWLVMDRILTSVEARTVGRWGIVRNVGT